jgi:hypothetical protein
VAQQILDRTNIIARFEQMRGEAVAQEMAAAGLIGGIEM